jgi:hypothetical protein
MSRATADPGGRDVVTARYPEIDPEVAAKLMETVLKPLELGNSASKAFLMAEIFVRGISGEYSVTTLAGPLGSVVAAVLPPLALIQLCGRLVSSWKIRMGEKGSHWNHPRAAPHSAGGGSRRHTHSWNRSCSPDLYYVSGRDSGVEQPFNCESPRFLSFAIPILSPLSATFPLFPARVGLLAFSGW